MAAGGNRLKTQQNGSIRNPSLSEPFQSEIFFGDSFDSTFFPNR